MKIRLLKVPPCGYVVIGRGTYPGGNIVDVSNVDPEEVKDLLEKKYIEEYDDPPSPTPRAKLGQQ